MEDVLERRQCKEDGSASDEYLINEEFMAMLDYYVAACLSARASEAAGFRSFYAERVLLYKALDGKERRRASSWRPALLEVLRSWLERFPDCVTRRSSGTL